MSKHGTEFLHMWVQKNISAGSCQEAGGKIAAAVQCLCADAEAEGLTREDIEEDVADLHDFILKAASKNCTDA
jgi:hypothetical protein